MKFWERLTGRQEGLPSPDRVFLFGANFEPSREAYLLMAKHLVGQHPPLTLRHVRQAIVSVQSTPGSENLGENLDALAAALEGIRRTSPGALMTYCIMVDQSTNHFDMAIAAIWEKRTAQVARQYLPRAELIQGP